MRRYLKSLFLLAILLFAPAYAHAAGEIKTTDPSGKTVYSVILNQAGLAWNGSTFATVANANWSTYPVLLSEQGTTGIYVGSFPGAITTPGRYSELIYERAGGSAAVGDTLIAQGTLDWDGAALALPLSQGQLINTSSAAGTIGEALYYDDLVVGRRGTAQGGTSNTIQLDAGASATDGIFNTHFVKIVSGTGAGQFATISGYVGTTKVATITRPGPGTWTTIPDSTSVFLIWPQPMVTLAAGQSTIASNFVAAPTAAQIQAYLDGNSTQLAALITGQTGIKAKTDLLLFDGSSYLNTHVKANDILTGYSATATNLPGDYLSSGEQAALTNASSTSTAINNKLGTPVLSTLALDIASRLAGSAYTAPLTAAQYAVAPAWWLAPPSDYQQRGQAVTLPTTPPAGYGGGSGPTAIQIRQEIDSNSAQLAAINAQTTAAQQQANMIAALTAQGYTVTRAAKIDNADIATSTRLPTSGYTAPTTPPTAIAIRQEIDNNSTQLASLVSGQGTISTSVSAIKAKTDQLLYDGSSYLNVHAKVLDDKTGISLSSAEEDAIVLKWLTRTIGHGMTLGQLQVVLQARFGPGTLTNSFNMSNKQLSTPYTLPGDSSPVLTDVTPYASNVTSAPPVTGRTTTGTIPQP
ncbi:hypothetical protein CCAX7_14380 [Capsulimonas corticalis]|uniref:Uncharacterized protein n=1 Tax=Capsulimonas corticalis TaxID=2219043 RepID=A0A402D734_9BACT|nr:hypothetical protein [Capsulimonas corticalis]BDI29387.1 hypothetical protein CCAX7_14380 [Capsulimonas corticalis]